MFTDLAKYLSMQDNIAISRNHDNNNETYINVYQRYHSNIQPFVIN